MIKPLSFLLAAALVLQPALQTTLLGQQTTGTPQPSLPPAPDAKPVGQALMDAQNQAAQVANAFDADAEKRASQVNGPGGKTLTRKEAEQLAIRNNPHISQYKLLALAQNQVVRETRSALLPTLAINATGVGAEQASRISSGTLDSSRMLNHMGAGVELTQLIYDFGHTNNLVATSALQAKAASANSIATLDEIVLTTDVAFYNTLEAQATVRVAKQNLAARQAVRDQIAALTAAKLRSDLDLSFAEVNLSQAKLFLLDANNLADVAMAQLNRILGLPTSNNYKLIDESDPLPEIALTPDPLLQQAMQQRPDLQAYNFTHQADVKFSKAERDQLLPTVSALGILGATPAGSSQYYNPDWYGAAGVNVQIPVFNGFLFTAQTAQARLQARASDERTRNLVERIQRDVKSAWLNANTARQKMVVTAELLKEANMALDLAQTRYNLGLSSIVELSQAEYQQTQAAIQDTNARFSYESDLAAIRYQIGVQP
jgi:outer membrane protein